MNNNSRINSVFHILTTVNLHFPCPVYGRMCMGYMQLWDNFICGTWAPEGFRVHRRSWNQYTVSKSYNTRKHALWDVPYHIQRRGDHHSTDLRCQTNPFVEKTSFIPLFSQLTNICTISFYDLPVTVLIRKTKALLSFLKHFQICAYPLT